MRIEHTAAMEASLEVAISEMDEWCKENNQALKLLVDYHNFQEKKLEAGYIDEEEGYLIVIFIFSLIQPFHYKEALTKRRERRMCMRRQRNFKLLWKIVKLCLPNTQKPLMLIER